MHMRKKKILGLLLPPIILLFLGCAAQSDLDPVVYRVGVDDIYEKLSEVPEGGILQYEYQDGDVLTAFAYAYQRIIVRGKGKDGPQLVCEDGIDFLFLEGTGDSEVSDFNIDGCSTIIYATISEANADGAGLLKVTNSRFTNGKRSVVEISADEAVNIMISNCDFEDNYSGLALANKYEQWELPPTIDIVNSTFARTQNGAVHVSGLEVFNKPLEYDTFDLHPIIQIIGCTFSDNSLPLRSNENYPLIGGAAVYVEWAQRTTIESCIFEGNSVPGEDHRGGAVYATKSRSFRVEDSFFNKNSAPASGGAILLSSIQIVEVLETNFTANLCTSFSCDGGAISWEDHKMDAPVIEVKNLQFKWTSRIQDCALEGNSAGFGGGLSAIARDSFGGLTGFYYIKKSYFSNNIARFGGGGLRVKSKSVLDMGSVTFVGNQADRGGAIMLSLSGSVRMVAFVFQQNTAKTAGGSVFSSSLSKLAVSNCSFESSAAGTVGGALALDGVEDTSVLLSSFSRNTAAEGGGIFFASRSLISNKLLVDGSIFIRNDALQNLGLDTSRDFFNGAGGALVINSLENPDQGSLEVEISGSRFFWNKASGGGALFIVTDKDSTYQEGSRNVLMKGNIFSANSASEAGGLLLVDTTQGIQVACSRSYPIWKSLDELYQSSFCPGWRPSIGNSDMAERVNKNNIEHIAYGEMFASVSVGMLKVDPQSIKTLSGVSLERFVVTPMDLFGQEMTTDVLLTSIEIRPILPPNSNVSFAGERQAAVENGSAIFHGMSVIGNPGSYSINFTDFGTNGLSPRRAMAELDLVLRDCVPGEVKQISHLFGCIQCTSGLYSFNPENTTCDPCPERANCSAAISENGVMLRHPLVPKDGYWHSTPFSTQIQKCLSEDACTYLGRTSTLQSFQNPYPVPTKTSFNQTIYQQCLEGHHGVLCGACDSDFGHTGVGECTKCQVTWWYIIVLVVTRCLSLVLVIATLKGNMTSEDDDLESTDTYYPLGTFRMRDLEMYSTWARQRGMTSAVSVTEDETPGDEVGEESEHDEVVKEADQDLDADNENPCSNENSMDLENAADSQPYQRELEIIEEGKVAFEEGTRNSEKVVYVEGLSFQHSKTDKDSHSNALTSFEPNEDHAESLEEQVEADNPKLKVTEMMKIMINFAQVTGTAFLIDFAWPPGIRQMMGIQDLLSSATVFWGATERALSDTAWMPRSLSSLVLSISNPITIFICVTLFWIFRSVSQRQTESYKPFSHYIVPRLLVTVWSITFFFYDSWTESFMKLLYCPSVDKHIPDTPYYEFAISQDRVWAQDTDVLCFQGAHTILFFAVGIPGLVFFTLGVPVALFLFIMLNFNRLNDPAFRNQYGFMYLNYDLEFAYWESAIMLRKAAIVTIAVLAHSLGQSLQGLFMFGVIFFATVAHTVTRPLPLDMLDNMETWSLMTTAITFFSAVVFSDPGISDIIRTLFTVIVYSVNALFLAHFSFAFVHSIREFVIAYKYGEDAARELQPHVGFLKIVYYMVTAEMKSLSRYLRSIFRKKKRSSRRYRYPRNRHV